MILCLREKGHYQESTLITQTTYIGWAVTILRCAAALLSFSLSLSHTRTHTHTHTQQTKNV